LERFACLILLVKDGCEPAAFAFLVDLMLDQAGSEGIDSMQKALVAVCLIAFFGLSACGTRWPEVDQVAQAKMIGLSKKSIRACMGDPSSRKAIGSTEIWSYDSGTTELEGSGFATFGYPRHPHCRVNVVMTNGIVSQINYAGPAGDSPDLGERCSFAVAPCAGQ
jgi:hypothetical protein